MKKNAQKGSQVSPKQKRIFITFAIVIGIPLFAYGAAEFSYQQRVQKLENAASTFAEVALKPEGGVSLGKTGTTCPHFLDWVGSHFDDRGPCPGVGTSWLIPVKLGQEASFISSILKSAGYSGGLVDGGAGGGQKDGVGINIELTGLGNNKEPYSPPAGKVWTRVDIDAQEPLKH